MRIVWKDDFGCMQIEVDEYGILFQHGYAEFSDDDGQEYSVPIKQIVAIRED